MEDKQIDESLDNTGYRSMTWTLHNKTDDVLKLQNAYFEHGRWDCDPTGSISIGGTGYYSVCSRDAALIGVEGRATWCFEKRSQMYFMVTFSNPISGANSFTASPPTDDYKCRIDGSIHGNHAVFDLYFEKI